MYQFEEGECSFRLYNEKSSNPANDKPFADIDLPCYAQEVSESVTANWGTQNILGRTGSLFAYTGTSDTSFSFSMDLHMEYYWQVKGLSMNATDDNAIPPAEAEFNKCMTMLKASAYPTYGNYQDKDTNAIVALAKPTRVRFKFGTMIVDGKVDSVNIVWKMPIINKKYAVATATVNMSSASSTILSTSNIINVDKAIRGLDY